MFPDLVRSEPLSDGEAKFISMNRVTNGIRDYDWNQSGGECVRDVGARQIATVPFKQRNPIPASAAKLLRVAWQTELGSRFER